MNKVIISMKSLGVSTVHCTVYNVQHTYMCLWKVSSCKIWKLLFCSHISPRIIFDYSSHPGRWWDPWLWGVCKNYDVKQFVGIMDGMLCFVNNILSLNIACNKPLHYLLVANIKDFSVKKIHFQQLWSFQDIRDNTKTKKR